jgi:hypothetical protein
LTPIPTGNKGSLLIFSVIRFFCPIFTCNKGSSEGAEKVQSRCRADVAEQVKSKVVAEQVKSRRMRQQG